MYPMNNTLGMQKRNAIDDVSQEELGQFGIAECSVLLHEVVDSRSRNVFEKSKRR